MNKKLKKIIIFIFIITLIMFTSLTIINLLNNNEIQYNLAISKMIESGEKIKSDLSTGTTYYVSSDGTSTDGTDINNPMSLTQAKTKTYGNDDRILFKRGDTFYGTISLTLSNNDGYVYIGAYGEGEKPIISGANILINPEAWLNENNIYKIDLSNSENFVGIGELNWEPYNIAFLEDENGNIYGARKRYLDELTENFDFYCENQFLYMKSNENPSKLLGKIKFVQRCDLIKISSNMIIENLNIQNCGAHAISKKEETIENVYIKNCIIQNIGGSLQVAASFTRYGNGIEFWNQAKNTLVENCILRNIFDTGYTLQGDSNLDGFENNIFRNNILINCSYDTEIFSYDKNNPDKQSKIERYIYENNISINQGRGWGYEYRNNTRVASVLVFWANDTLPDYADMTMRNNIYYNFRNLYYTYNVYNNPVPSEKYKNVLVTGNNQLYLSNDSTLLCGEGDYYNIAVLEEYGQEKDSNIYLLTDEEKENINNEEILSSNDYNEIKQYYLDLNKQFMYNDEIEKIVVKYNQLYENINYENNNLKNEINGLINIIKNLSAENNAKYVLTQIEDCMKLGETILKNNDLSLAEKTEISNYFIEIGQSYENLINIMNKFENTYDIDYDNINDFLEESNKLISENKDIQQEYITNLLELSEQYNEKYNESQKAIKHYNYIMVKYTCTYSNILIKSVIDEYIEANPVTVSYSNTDEWTNQDVTATLNIGNDATVTNNGGSNTYTFKANGSFTFEYERRGQAFKLEAKVSNIDKTYPTITGVKDGQTYTNSVSPVVKDTNLSIVSISYNGENIEYYEGITLEDEGMYSIVATDRAGNTTTVEFNIISDVQDEYVHQGNYLLNVWQETTLADFKNNYTSQEESYIIKRNDTELTDTDIIATGDIIELSSGDTYTIVVAGDINCDGRVTVFDLSALRRFILKQIEFTEIELLSADINLDGNNIGAKDYSRMRLEILGMH